MDNKKLIADYLTVIDEVIEKGEYKDNWDSLSKYPAAAWYSEAKFGMFIHWGVYSVPAFFSEWYTRMMLYRGNPTYWYHRYKYGKKFSYRDFIPMFKAENFNAAAWAETAKNTGCRFMMPVAEHHDGFKLYDSDLSRWTSVNMGPMRDIIGELKTACEKTGIIFSTSSHRAEHYWFNNGCITLGYKTEVLDEEYRDLYGPCVSVRKGNNLFVMLKEERGIDPDKDWLEDWLVSSCDLIDRYQPASLFFDWWVSHKAFRPYMKKFLAYYYNRSREWGREVCVYYKSDAVMYNCAVFDRERGQISGVSPYIWQGETATAKNAWSYCVTNVYKKSEKIACNMLDVISKNGCFVLNIGPKADGTICEKEMSILRDMGEFTKKNEEAIWGTKPYKVAWEGKTQKAGTAKENFKYSKEDFRFTYKNGVIYAFALIAKGRKTFKIKSLAQSRDMFNFEILNIELLGESSSVKYSLSEKYLELRLDKAVAHNMPVCFKISVD